MKNKDRTRTQRWRRDVWRLLSREGFKPYEMNAGLVLVGVITAGTDPTALSELTGLSVDYVRTVLKRLRKQRILVGQSVRSSIFRDDAISSEVGLVLDVGSAAGTFARFTDPKRSASQRARAPETRARGPRSKPVGVTPGAVFSPKAVKSDPLYGLPEWAGKVGDESKGTS